MHFSIRVSSLIVFLGILAAALIFFVFIGDFYYEKEEVSLAADASLYYAIAARDLSFPLIALGQNYLGPVLLLRLTEFDNFLVFLVNSSLFLLAYYLLVKAYDLHRIKFALLVLMNPLVITSLLLVNKEIIGLCSIAMFAYYLKRRTIFMLIMATLFGLLARWQTVFVFVVYLAVTCSLNPMRRSRGKTIALLIVGLSVLYPLFFLSLGDVRDADTAARQAVTGFGLITALNSLQDHYLYFLAVLPKILSNLFGNVFRLFDYVIDPSSVDTYDIYNSFLILGHQLATLVVTVALVMKRKIRIEEDLVYFSLIYLILFSLATMVQYRYIFPIYILFCIGLATKTRPQSVIIKQPDEAFRLSHNV